MSLFFRKFYEFMDFLSLSFCELTKTLFLEIYLIQGQLVEGFLIMILFLVYDLKDFFSVGMEKLKVLSKEKFGSLNRIILKKNLQLKSFPNDFVYEEDYENESVKSEESNASTFRSNSRKWTTFSNVETASVFSLDDFIFDEKERIISGKNPNMSLFRKVIKNLVKLFFLLPMLIYSRLRNSKTSVDLGNLKVKYEEKKTTGLIEDFHLKMLEFVDKLGESFRFFIRFKFFQSIKCLFNGILLFKPSEFLKQACDDRSIIQIIKDEGYPNELYNVVTDDGYILEMERIVNRKSKNVIYFQHGIVDSSYCWVGNKDRSIAFRLADKGFDVFLGNFRGYSGTPDHLNKKIGKNYWDFSIDELIKYDIKSFISKILEIKKEEGLNPKKIKITLISHSMGGAVGFGYLVNQIVREKKDHHLIKGIFLAPGGIHSKIGNIWLFLSNFIFILYVLNVKYLGITNKNIKIFFTKIFMDLVGNNRGRSFVSAFISGILGGTNENMFTIKWENLFYHLFFGTSRKLLQHFVDLFGKQNFYAYDYGKKKNLEIYGKETPFCYTEHYDKIDIPIVIIAGDQDNVIPESEVKKHYIKLINKNPNLMHKWKVCLNTGHIDLTYAITEEIIQYIEENVIDDFERINSLNSIEELYDDGEQECSLSKRLFKED